jgi:hypothetical protein
VKAPRLQVGNGTLGRFQRQRPVVIMTLRGSGYGTEEMITPSRHYMTASEARKLANRLLVAADKAEARMAR